MAAAGVAAGRIPRRGDGRSVRVGLLGGSFNPAHEGHRAVARMAMARLGLDQVWLLVSPGNPLKAARGMAPLADRLASAAEIADGRRVLATDIERVLGTRFTVDTLKRLRVLFPRARFVWLMGADGLAELPRWRRWKEIVRTVPVAVLPRPGWNHRALGGRAAHLLSRGRRRAANTLADRAVAMNGLPAWSFLFAPEKDISATRLRETQARPWPRGAIPG
ncbi:MAG: nicotinate-nucleotide adenylyltransferase [Gluconacetobacter diazotrophicus]|nr:nicotinate-nucleotide adenylyltransferase [Gluconacetobacter diazotrophicus]